MPVQPLHVQCRAFESPVLVVNLLFAFAPAALHRFVLQGNAHGILNGKWNSHVDFTPSKPDGTPADGASAKRLWACAAKPEDDAYGCTHFAWKLANCDLLRNAPLPSDSRRRADRHLLQERQMTAAAAEKGLIEDEQRNERKVGCELGRSHAGLVPWTHSFVSMC